MSDDDFLAALSAVDAGFADYPSWQQVKQLAAVHPWTLSSRLLTPGQQSVLAFWRIFSRDDQGRSNAPMPSEGTADQILESLRDFQEDFEVAVLTNADFDLSSIEQVFASLSSGASTSDQQG
jgi:hypothetical protein